MSILDQLEIIDGFGLFGEPMLTIEKERLWVNTASLRAVPEALYILFLFDRAEQILIVKPGAEDEARTIRWKTARGNPRKLCCEGFLAGIAADIEWNRDCRRKISGKIARDESGVMLVFDLKKKELQSLGEHLQNPLVKRLEEDIVNEN